MKAILVINLPDGYGEITDNKATVNLRNFKLDTSLYVCNVPLKPMPQYMTMKNVVRCDYNEAFVNGFNTCIDELLGE